MIQFKNKTTLFNLRYRTKLCIIYLDSSRQYLFHEWKNFLVLVHANVLIKKTN